MPYNFVADIFTQRNFVADFFKQSEILHGNRPFCVFEPPFNHWGAYGQTYDVHLRLIGKCVVDFLLVLIEFFVRCYDWCATSANISSKSAISLQQGPVDSKFQFRGDPTNHSSQKTRLNNLSYGIKMWTNLSSVLPQCTRSTDRRTGKQTDRQLSRD